MKVQVFDCGTRICILMDLTVYGEEAQHMTATSLSNLLESQFGGGVA